MVDSQNKFLELLGSFINEKDPQLNNDIDWKEINRLAKIHNVSGIIGYMSGKLPQEQKPGPQLQKTMSDILYNTIAVFTNRAYAMQQLIQVYEKHDIPCLLMKGFLVRECYPVPELRTYGDIDFLIKQQDRERSHQLMIELGYEFTGSGTNAVWSYKKGIEYYEIHTHILNDIGHLSRDYISYLGDVWKYAVPYTGLSIFRLNPEFEFIYLFLHMSKHFSYSGAGIRMFLDIVLFSKHFTGLNKEYISDELNKLGLFPFACSVSKLCRKLFEISLPVVEDDDAELTCYHEFVDYIISGGVFGFHEQELGTPALRLEYCKGATSNRFAKIRFIWMFLFPPYEKMRASYKFLNKRPFLLPIGWVYRIFRNIFRGQLKVLGDQVRITQNSDIEKAKSQYELFKSIGLADVINNSKSDNSGTQRTEKKR